MNDIELLAESDFSGAVLVAQGGSLLFSKAFGYADRPNQRPNNITTKFGTASAGKAFVATAIMRLIERAALQLDSTIGEFLHLGANIDSTISIRQLLNHTSGIPDYFDESIMNEYAELWVDVPNYRIRSSWDLVPLFKDKPMMYPKGEKFQYNNTGYVVLGLIIEVITGVPFDQHLHEVIFEPCNMTSTGYYELDRLPENCANAYILDEERKEFYTNIFSIDVKGSGAGGAFASIGDIFRFWDHLINGKIVSSETLSRMLSPQVPSKDYGYGFWLAERADGSFLPYFQGCDPGVSFISSYDATGLCVVVVSNMGDDVWRIHREIRAGTLTRP